MTKAEKIPVVQVPVHKYALKLTQEEAQFLLDVMVRIGGLSIATRRKHADAISQALRSVDVTESRAQDFHPKFNSIYFE